MPKLSGQTNSTNPAPWDGPGSLIHGMWILDVNKAQNVLFVKRFLSPGYAGINNGSFYPTKTMMLFAGAKKFTQEVVKTL